ncbi:hypothetical protein GCM10018987_12870 [Streptomyces cremeus]
MAGERAEDVREERARHDAACREGYQRGGAQPGERLRGQEVDRVEGEDDEDAPARGGQGQAQRGQHRAAQRDGSEAARGGAGSAAAVRQGQREARDQGEDGGCPAVRSDHEVTRPRGLRVGADVRREHGEHREGACHVHAGKARGRDGSGGREDGGGRRLCHLGLMASRRS